jgi:hypothetical protein
VSRVDSVVVRKAEVDASLVVVIASVEVFESLISNVARGVVVVVPLFASVVVSTAEVDASIEVVIASVEVIELVDANVVTGIVVDVT